MLFFYTVNINILILGTFKARYIESIGKPLTAFSVVLFPWGKDWRKKAKHIIKNKFGEQIKACLIKKEHCVQN